MNVKDETKMCNCTLGGSAECYDCEVYIKHCGLCKPTYEEFLKNINRIERMVYNKGLEKIK